MSIKISGFQVGGSGGGIPQYGPVPLYYNIGAAGTPSITYSAPANSTTLVCVSTDTGANDMWIDGWDQQIDAKNGGAQYWSFSWLSSIGNPEPVNNLTVNAVNAMNPDGNAGRYIVIAETLLGDTGMPNIVGTGIHFQSNSSNTSVGFGINDGEIIIVHASVEKGGGQITSMTGGGLTWTRKSSKSQDSSHETGLYQTTEVWYAINQTGSAIEDTVTINYSSQFDDQATIISNWSGVNLTTPFWYD